MQDEQWKTVRRPALPWLLPIWKQRGKSSTQDNEAIIKDNQQYRLLYQEK